MEHGIRAPERHAREARRDRRIRLNRGHFGVDGQIDGRTPPLRNPAEQPGHRSGGLSGFRYSEGYAPPELHLPRGDSGDAPARSAAPQPTAPREYASDIRLRQHA